MMNKTLHIIVSIFCICLLLVVFYSFAKDISIDHAIHAPIYVKVMAAIAVLWIIREVRNGNKNKHDN